MAYAPNLSTSRGLARFRPTQGVYQSAHPTKLSPGFVTSLKAMNRSRAGKPTRTSLQCSAELGSQQEPSLLNELAQVSSHPHLLLNSNCSMLSLRGIETLLALLPAGSSTVSRRDGLQDKGCSFTEQGSPCCKAPRCSLHTATSSCQRRARCNSKAKCCCRSEVVFASHINQGCSYRLLVIKRQ